MFAAPECQTYSLAVANRGFRQTVSLALRRMSVDRKFSVESREQRIPGKNQKIFIPVFTGTGFLIFPGMTGFGFGSGIRKDAVF
jgi:hypothetical protein